MDLNGLLRTVVEIGASDLHLKIGQPPVVRSDGSLGLLPDVPPLDSRDLRSILEAICGRDPARLASFDATSELDTAYQQAGLPRFRVNAYRQRGEISFAFRVIPNEVPTFETLRLPPGVRRLAENHKGLVLVTGATGSGKTTTLASIVGHVNRTRKQHIVTIEDPIEVLHDDEGCIVNQREVGLDTDSFGQALRRALRQDPDVILIGELRDSETAETALQAAESGHLVLSTMHTVDAAETVSRMIEFFPAIKQNQIRAILAGVLCGVVSQRLCRSRRRPRRGGRGDGQEQADRGPIRENRAEEIPPRSTTARTSRCSRSRSAHRARPHRPGRTRDRRERRRQQHDFLILLDTPRNPARSMTPPAPPRSPRMTMSLKVCCPAAVDRRR